MRRAGLVGWLVLTFASCVGVVTSVVEGDVRCALWAGVAAIASTSCAAMQRVAMMWRGIAMHPPDVLHGNPLN